MATASKATTSTRDEWVSLGAAARELSESRLKVLTRVVARELEAQHIAGQTFISRKSLDALAGAAT